MDVRLDPKHVALPTGFDTHEIDFGSKVEATITVAPVMTSQFVDGSFQMVPKIGAQIWLRWAGQRGRGDKYGLAFIGDDVADALRQVGLVWTHGGLEAIATGSATGNNDGSE